MFLTNEEGNILTVTPEIAVLDARVAAEFREKFSEFANGDQFILLDLSNVTFMDSSGLAAVVYCFQMTDIRRRLAICSATKRVMQLFSMTRMEDVVHLYPDHEAAVAALAKGEIPQP
ncbi:MAG: anti-sigma factor antagonist [Acidobacteriota bacterium]|nr:anti-sigma factor antagonist [Acidobacteriota bacterium]